MTVLQQERTTDRFVLLVISSGLIAIILSIIAGIYLTPRALPNWAENVLVSIGTATTLKLGDCLSTLIALSTGRSVERLGVQLGQSAPPDTSAPADAAEAARQTADAADKTAEAIAAKATPPATRANDGGSTVADSDGDDRA